MDAPLLKSDLLDGLNDAILLLKETFEVDYLNQKAKDFLGLAPTCLSQDYFELCHKEKITPVADKAVMQSFLKNWEESSCQNKKMEVTVKTKGKIIQWTMRKLSTPHVILLVGTDVSSSFALKEELKRKEHFFKNVLENVPGYIFWKDTTSKFLGCNANFSRIAGETPDSIIGKVDYDLPWKHEEADRFIADDREVIKTGQPKLNIEESMKYVDGKEATLLTNKVALRDQQGNICGVIGVFLDITERKKSEEALKQAKESAEVALTAKADFLVHMRHSTQIALEGIINIARELRQEAKDHPYFKECAENLEISGNAFLSFLHRILETIRATSGHEPTLIQKCNLHPLFQEIINLHKHLAHHQGVRLTFSYDTDIPTCLIGDTRRIAQLFLELLSNALKFTKNGEVSVKVSLLQREESRCIVKLSIQDTGCGIPETDKTKIYTLFHRVGPPGQAGQGSGIGLSLVHRFIQDLGGEIDMQSRVGEGTHFSCQIPLKLPLLSDEKLNEQIPSKASVHNLNPIRVLKSSPLQNPLVLLVEHHSTSAHISSMLLEKCGYAVDSVCNAKHALDKIAKIEYGLILMNIDLPDMPGYECAKNIRA